MVPVRGVEEKNDAGEKIDNTTADAEIANKTDVVLTSVAGNEKAIGYISLGALNDTVKAVKVDGAEATVDNVKAGTYKLSRPFNIATKGEPTGVAKDFINFILSKEGQAVVTDNKYIAVDDNAAAFTSDGSSGQIAVGGSSSVSPVMEKLIEAYKAVNPNASIDLQTSDSTSGMTGTIYRKKKNTVEFTPGQKIQKAPPPQPVPQRSGEPVGEPIETPRGQTSTGYTMQIGGLDAVPVDSTQDFMAAYNAVRPQRRPAPAPVQPAAPVQTPPAADAYDESAAVDEPSWAKHDGTGQWPVPRQWDDVDGPGAFRLYPKQCLRDGPVRPGAQRLYAAHRYARRTCARQSGQRGQAGPRTGPHRLYPKAGPGPGAARPQRLHPEPEPTGIRRAGYGLLCQRHRRGHQHAAAGRGHARL